MTGYFVFLLNSVLLAFFKFKIFLENSIIAICIPKQIPKYGSLFSLAYLQAIIIPSIPLLPNPPGIRTAWKVFNIFEAFPFVIFAASIILTSTLARFLMPA